MNSTVTKQAWTPGPWRTSVNSERGIDVRDLKRKDGSSLLIAEVFEITDRDANAKLIASAPELAKELEMAHRHIQHLLEMLAGTRRKEQREVEPIVERRTQREAALQKAGAL